MRSGDPLNPLLYSFCVLELWNNGFSYCSRKVSKALDQALADHFVLTQSKQLAQAFPKDTGRIASSFYVWKDKPDLSTRPLD